MQRKSNTESVIVATYQDVKTQEMHRLTESQAKDFFRNRDMRQFISVALNTQG